MSPPAHRFCRQYCFNPAVASNICQYTAFHLPVCGGLVSPNARCHWRNADAQNWAFPLALTICTPQSLPAVFVGGWCTCLHLADQGWGFCCLSQSHCCRPSLCPHQGWELGVVHRTVMEQATDKASPKPLLTQWGKVQPNPDRTYGFFINACGMFGFMHISSVFLLT